MTAWARVAVRLLLSYFASAFRQRYSDQASIGVGEPCPPPAPGWWCRCRPARTSRHCPGSRQSKCPGRSCPAPRRSRSGPSGRRRSTSPCGLRRRPSLPPRQRTPRKSASTVATALVSTNKLTVDLIDMYFSPFKPTSAPNLMRSRAFCSVGPGKLHRYNPPRLWKEMRRSPRADISPLAGDRSDSEPYRRLPNGCDPSGQ